MKKSFIPMGAPVFLAAGSGHSLNGGVSEGTDVDSSDYTYISVGNFDVEDWGGNFTVYYCPDDEDYYILIDGSYESIGWGGEWDGLGF